MNPQSLFVSQGIGAAHGRFHAKLEIVFSPHFKRNRHREWLHYRQNWWRNKEEDI
jgi:hypothetical protein